MLSNHLLSALRAAQEYGRHLTCEEGFRDGKRLLGFAEARIKCIQAWARMFTLVAIALLVVTTIGCAPLGRPDCGGWLRRVRSRRRARSELSPVRSVIELLTQGADLWQLLDHRKRLNLEASL